MSSSCCKVGEVTNRYQIRHPTNFDSVNNYLVTRWCGLDGLQKTGLRPLVDWFNKSVLESVYFRQDRHQIDSHIDSDYQILHSVSEEQHSDRQVLLDDLRQDGIDGEAVSNDFVSTTTLYRHLTNCLNAEKEREKSHCDWERKQVSHIRDRTNNDLQNVLTSLDNKERIIGAADVDTSVTLYLKCPVCTREVCFKQAIHQGYVCQLHLPAEDGEKSEPDQPQEKQPSIQRDQSTFSQCW